MRLGVLKIAALGMFGFASISGAQSFTNGSLTGPIANAGVPTGWSVLLGSPDTMDPFNNVGVPGALTFGATPSYSPDGGTWVGMGRDGAGFVERFGQTVAGFTTGQSYTVSWYASNFGYADFGYTNPNMIELFVGGSSVGSGASLGNGPGWFLQSLTFTAGASSQDIAFQLGSTNRSYMGIDGLTVARAGTVVPEPATFVLLAAGLGVVGVLKRRKRVS